MLQMIYSSAAVQPFTQGALDTLLSKARARNSVHQVSGMLVYDAGSFLQVLEGPEASVELILNSVLRDPRHRNCRTLSQKTIATREFSSWAMGFARADVMWGRPPGHVDYVRELPQMAEAPSHARRFLRFFQEGMYRQAPVF